MFNNIPTIFTILGITGDLSTEKLLPALYDLYHHKKLPDNFFIFGFARRELSKAQFQKFVIRSIHKKYKEHSESKIKKFAKKCVYMSGDFKKARDFKILGEFIAQKELGLGICMNKLYYLAVPPVYYRNILVNLAKNSLNKPCSKETGWARVLIEKPFGSDIKMARKLNLLLENYYQEEQIYRIDHYLAKTLVESILYIRFLNTFFEPMWSNKYIEKIEIDLLERKGVGTRGVFYDGLGALRDVGQNHILQLVSLLLMNRPKEFTPQELHKQKAKVISSLKKYTKLGVVKHATRGQYVGYTREKNIPRASETETYFKLLLESDYSKWKDVPITVTSGKGLSKNYVGARIYLKPQTDTFIEEEIVQNILEITIQPKQEIKMELYIRSNDIAKKIIRKDVILAEDNTDYEHNHDAYERILHDCIHGDRTLFPSNAEQDASWKFIASIVKNWDMVPLHKYKKGSSGPRF